MTALRQVDAGAPIPEVPWALGISEATYYVWRKQYGQLAIAGMRRFGLLPVSKTPGKVYKEI